MRYLLVLVFSSLALAQAQPLQVGFGRRSLVTERKKVPLGGYGGRGLIPMNQVHDEVMVKAMVIQSGDQAFCLVSFDLIGVQRTLLAGLERRGFPERVKLDADDLLLCASHAHSSYGGLAKPTGALLLDGLFFVTCGPFNRGFFDEVLEKVRAAIVDAWDDLAPARFGVGSEDVPGLSRNRGRSGDVTDPELGVLKVTAPDGTLRGLVVNFTAHPVLVGAEYFAVSAGFPGAMQRTLEARYPGATVLFTNGAEGDQSVTAPPGDHADTWAKVEATGARLADHVDRIQRGVETRGSLGLATRCEELRLPRPKKLQARLKYLGGQKTSLFAQAVLGDTLLMGIPGEPCCRIGLDLKRAAKARGFRHAFVIGLAQDHCGYFVHRHDYAAEFDTSHDYEKQLNFYGPGVGEFFVDVHLRQFDPQPKE